MIADTVAAHASTVVKSSSMVRIDGGSGVRRTQTRATTPSVPSLPPPRRGGRSRPPPGASLPNRSTVPSDITTSIARMCAEVTP